MRLIHTCTGLLSIIGAAFLFATAHALVIEPVNIDAPVTRTEGEVKGDPSRVRGTTTEQTPQMTDPGGEESAAEDANPLDTGAGIRDLRNRPQGGNEGQSQAEATPDPTPSEEMLDAPVPEGTLTLRQSHELWEQGAYFIDARHEHEYETGHIQYAAWLTSTLFDTDSDRAFGVVATMPPDATVVIYCVGGECDASKNVARRLQQIGFSDLRIMGVGYDDWVAAGFPTEQGSAP